MGDTLLFFASQFKETTLLLTQDHFAPGILYVKVMPIVNQLCEVIVQNRSNAVSLGIVSKGQKSYTLGIENERFVTVLKFKNVTMTTFLRGELATKYKEIIASEN